MCFAPLCALEMMESRVDGATIVVTMSVDVNQSALTLSEVIAKMQPPFAPHFTSFTPPSLRTSVHR